MTPISQASNKLNQELDLRACPVNQIVSLEGQVSQSLHGWLHLWLALLSLLNKSLTQVLFSPVLNQYRQLHIPSLSHHSQKFSVSVSISLCLCLYLSCFQFPKSDDFSNPAAQPINPYLCDTCVFKLFRNALFWCTFLTQTMFLRRVYQYRKFIPW